MNSLAQELPVSESLWDDLDHLLQAKVGDEMQHLDIISSLPLVDLAIIGYGLVAVPLACVAVVAVWKRGNRSE